MLERRNMYVFIMNKLFQKIRVEIHKQPSKNEKMQIIITCYLRWLVCEQIISEGTTTKEKEIIQKTSKSGG